MSVARRMICVLQGLLLLALVRNCDGQWSPQVGEMPTAARVRHGKQYQPGPDGAVGNRHRAVGPQFAAQNGYMLQQQATAGPSPPFGRQQLAPSSGWAQDDRPLPPPGESFRDGGGSDQARPRQARWHGAGHRHAAGDVPTGKLAGGDFSTRARSGGESLSTGKHQVRPFLMGTHRGPSKLAGRQREPSFRGNPRGPLLTLERAPGQPVQVSADPLAAATPAMSSTSPTSPANTVPLASPANTVPLASPANTVPLASPANTVPLASPANTVPLASASRLMVEFVRSRDNVLAAARFDRAPPCLRSGDDAAVASWTHDSNDPCERGDPSVAQTSWTGAHDDADGDDGDGGARTAKTRSAFAGDDEPGAVRPADSDAGSAGDVVIQASPKSPDSLAQSRVRNDDASEAPVRRDDAADTAVRNQETGPEAADASNPTNRGGSPRCAHAITASRSRPADGNASAADGKSSALGPRLFPVPTIIGVCCQRSGTTTLYKYLQRLAAAQGVPGGAASIAGGKEQQFFSALASVNWGLVDNAFSSIKGGGIQADIAGVEGAGHTSAGRAATRAGIEGGGLAPNTASRRGGRYAAEDGTATHATLYTGSTSATETALYEGGRWADVDIRGAPLANVSTTNDRGMASSGGAHGQNKGPRADGGGGKGPGNDGSFLETSIGAASRPRTADHTPLSLGFLYKAYAGRWLEPHAGTGASSKHAGGKVGSRKHFGGERHRYKNNATRGAGVASGGVPSHGKDPYSGFCVVSVPGTTPGQHFASRAGGDVRKHGLGGRHRNAGAHGGHHPHAGALNNAGARGGGPRSNPGAQDGPFHNAGAPTSRGRGLAEDAISGAHDGPLINSALPEQTYANRRPSSGHHGREQLFHPSLTFEVTPKYSVEPGAPWAMAHLLPDPSSPVLILTFRDPIKRAMSGWFPRRRPTDQVLRAQSLLPADFEWELDHVVQRCFPRNYAASTTGGGGGNEEMLSSGTPEKLLSSATTVSARVGHDVGDDEDSGASRMRDDGDDSPRRGGGDSRPPAAPGVRADSGTLNVGSHTGADLRPADGGDSPDPSRPMTPNARAAGGGNPSLDTGTVGATLGGQPLPPGMATPGSQPMPASGEQALFPQNSPHSDDIRSQPKSLGEKSASPGDILSFSFSGTRDAGGKGGDSLRPDARSCAAFAPGWRRHRSMERCLQASFAGAPGQRRGPTYASRGRPGPLSDQKPAAAGKPASREETGRGAADGTDGRSTPVPFGADGSSHRDTVFFGTGESSNFSGHFGTDASSNKSLYVSKAGSDVARARLGMDASSHAALIETDATSSRTNPPAESLYDRWLVRGLYSDQVRNLLCAGFAPRQIVVTSLAELSVDPGAVLRRVVAAVEGIHGHRWVAGEGALTRQGGDRNGVNNGGNRISTNNGDGRNSTDNGDGRNGTNNRGSSVDRGGIDLQGNPRVGSRFYKVSRVRMGEAGSRTDNGGGPVADDGSRVFDDAGRLEPDDFDGGGGSLVADESVFDSARLLEKEVHIVTGVGDKPKVVLPEPLSRRLKNMFGADIRELLALVTRQNGFWVDEKMLAAEFEEILK